MSQRAVKQTAARNGTANSVASARTRRMNKGFTLPGSAVSRNPSLLGEQLVHDVCAITNPFCDASKNTKWPDQSSGQTLSIPVRQRVNVTTDASGNAAVIFTANYSAGIIPGSVAGGEFVWAEVSPAVLALDPYEPEFTEADQYRLVSGGVRITPITSAMNSQGIINIIELPPADNVNDYRDFSLVSKNYPSYESLPLKSNDSVYATMRPSGATAREFRDSDFRVSVVAADPFTTGDWSSIVVNVAGGAASTIVAVVDIYMNYEVTVATVSSLGFLTTRAPRPNLTLTNASTAIVQARSIHRGTDTTIDESFMSKAWGYLKDAGSFARDNARPLLHLAAAGASAYSGDPVSAGGHLMMLADQPRGRMVD